MSQSRQCSYWLATDGKWYLRLGDFEYAYEDNDCTVYGPFDSYEAGREHERKFPNPGCEERDDSGTQPPPVDCVKPNRTNRYF